MDDLEINYADLTGMLHASKRVSPDYEVDEIVMAENDRRIITVRFKKTLSKES